MTTTVTVKTRGHGANVSVGGQSEFVPPNTERRFDTDDTMSLSLTQETADQAAAREEQEAKDRVPGSAENDELIKEVDPAKLRELSGADDNETGATETAQTTDMAAAGAGRRGTRAPE